MYHPPMRVARMRYDAVAPYRATDGAAGFDLSAPAADPEVRIPAGGTATIDLLLAFEVPRGHAMLLLSRSSQGKIQVRLANSVGLIDSDYRGSVSVMVENNGTEEYVIFGGMRIVQAVVVPFVAPDIKMVPHDGLSRTVRGSGGFGSTGA